MLVCLQIKGESYRAVLARQLGKRVTTEDRS